MIKVNEYFEGKLKSLGAEAEGRPFTAGVIEPGQYTIPTSSEEHVSIILGRCRVKVSGRDWIDVKEGDNFIVPAESEVSFDVEDPVAYLCLYK